MIFFKRKDYTIIVIIVASSIICIGVFLIFALHPFACLSASNDEKDAQSAKEWNRHIRYESNVSKQDCYLCGENPDSPLLEHWGENNVGIINLNTFEISKIEINRYDNEKNLMEEEAGYTQFVNRKFESGEIAQYIVSIDSGYAAGKVAISENSRLSADRLKKYLCSDCLTELMGKYTYENDRWSIGLVNFEGRYIDPFEECIVRFGSGDYYISSRYFNQEDPFIDLFVTFCPPRYK